MLTIENVKLADIAPFRQNAKLHPKEQVAQIVASIKEFGFNDPIAISETGEIIEGHGRFLAVKELATRKRRVYGCRTCPRNSGGRTFSPTTS
jgi:ParB-like chromosome segregation protein Spo0J